MGDALGARVLVAGLGDLGGRVLEMLAGNPRIETLLGCGQAGGRSAALVAQTALIADTLGGAAQVGHLATDLTDRVAVAAMLHDAAPDIVVFAASRHSWWRSPPAARALPYGVWLPLQLSLLRTFMLAHRDASSTASVIALPHPDAAGPVLAAEGLAPHAGAGNVAEVAAKLRLLTAAEMTCHRAEIEVRLVLHHAAERLAFPLFDVVPSGARPPYLCQVTVRSVPVAAEVIDRLLRRAYPLPGGTGSHQLTAATVVQLVDALLADRPQHLHVPSPAGLPGGYPVLVSSSGVELDLPAGISRSDAIAVNEQAAAFDGISAISPDGTIHYTHEATVAAHDLLGLTLRDTPIAALDEAADRLDAVLRALR